MSRPLGVILYEGPSLIDGAPIVALASYSPKNPKTGDMLQTWIMRSDIPPHHASADGRDTSVCGDCPHRLNPVTGRRSCYVLVHQAPRSAWAAYKRGRYTYDLDTLPWRPARLGAYGDPTAVPLAAWERLLIRLPSGHTGYTSQWAQPRAQGYRHLLMASVHSERQRDQAQAMGWRTFRIERPASDLALAYALDRREIICPSATHKMECRSCGLCDGANLRPSIVIEAHGSQARHLPIMG